jgi:predicted HAD superfamily Cof-like phosphohydrolase
VSALVDTLIRAREAIFVAGAGPHSGLLADLDAQIAAFSVPQQVLAVAGAFEASTPNVIGDVEEFHSKFGLTYDGRPRVLPLELAEFRRQFLGEEVQEYTDHSFMAAQALAHLDDRSRDALIRRNLEEMLDALVDEVYVCLGTAQLHGFNFREAWRRVHAANMRKVRAINAAESKRGTTFDVVKPPGWTPPDHSDLVRDHAHMEVTP